ncbi:histone-like nucleoid-structuring protein Lsr2 [Streptomyces cyaneofuscatus]|uniref:Lsr2 family DNA-binding protein n=1 Tax=Streptomyces cyaneofuscatus TaxID=66883 RepID=UPI0037A33D2F
MTVAALRALIDEELPGIPRHPAPRIPRTRFSAKDTNTMTTLPVPHPRPADPQPAETEAAPLAVGALIAWAHAHSDKAVRRLGDQAHLALGELRTRHQKEEQLTRVAAEEAELEERLAEVRARKAQLAPRGKPVRDYAPAAVRAWARAEGLTVPDRGQIPAAVLNAWREQHTTPEATR